MFVKTVLCYPNNNGKRISMIYTNKMAASNYLSIIIILYTALSWNNLSTSKEHVHCNK